MWTCRCQNIDCLKVECVEASLIRILHLKGDVYKNYSTKRGGVNCNIVRS